MTIDRNKLFILHIYDAIDKIEERAAGISKEQFLQDDVIQDSVVRQFEILGEAINNLSDEIKEKYSQIEWNKAVGLRNALIHGYFDVDFEIVWGTIKNDLPDLKTRINEMIRDLKIDLPVS